MKPRASNYSWTPGKDAKLCRLWDDGVPAEDIMERMGLTNAQIRKRLEKIHPNRKRRNSRGVPMKQWTAKQDADLIRMWDEGVELCDIMEKLGVTRHQIRKRLEKIYPDRQKRGLPRRKWQRWEVDFLVDHYRKPGWTQKRIAEHLGRTVLMIDSKADQIGLRGEMHRNAKPRHVVNMVLKLAAQNKPANYICIQTGVSKVTFYEILKRHPVHHKKWKEMYRERKMRAAEEARRNYGKGKARYTVSRGLIRDKQTEKT